MKKTALLILGLLLASTGVAKEVTSADASQAAMRLVKAKSVNVTDVKSVEPVYQSGTKAYYVVNFAPQGWALISADDKSTPLLGYSPEGSFSIAEVPFNMEKWLDVYGEQIIDNAGMNIKRAAGWETGASVTPKAANGASIEPKASTDVVSPLITVNWNQGGKFSKYCPTTTGGSRAVVGCVAVSMAQAMSVVKYPARPQGKHAYTSSNFGDMYCNYDNEPAYNWTDILTGANSYDDVARLLWHCGIAVNMQYGVDGSGTQNSYIATALKRNFAYPSSVTSYSRSSFSDAQWKSMILEELTNGRAICYAGDDGSYGHAFNFDGYDGSMYHVNWGWGGVGNGYFTLDNLSDYQVGANYVYNHQMVVGVRAPSEAPTDITLSNTSVAENQPVGTVVGKVTVVSEATNPEYTYEVVGKKTLFGSSKCPFTVKDGNLVTTEVLKASEYADVVTGNSSCVANITATNKALGKSVTRSFTITIKTSTGIEEIQAEEAAEVEYYNLQGVRVENPENGIFIKKQGSKTTKVVL